MRIYPWWICALVSVFDADTDMKFSTRAGTYMDLDMDFEKVVDMNTIQICL